MEIKVPRYSINQIRRYASDFLSKYHPKKNIPVPIEDIIDLNFGINIIPFPGLVDYEINAYTWADMQNIMVDEYLYSKPNQYRRYRFTLAHEMGHIILHSEILKACQVDSIEAYLQFRDSIGEEDYRWIERHADTFAGLILVPSEQLKVKFLEAQTMAKSQGLDPEDEGVRGYMSDWISDFFEVSAQAIETRLVYDELLPYKKHSE